MSAILIPAAIALPLVLAGLAALPGLRRHGLTLSLAAPAGGLAAALFAPQGVAVSLPSFLLGSVLELSASGAIFLGGASLLWGFAGLHARRSMAGLDQAGVFALSWNLSFAGLAGVFLSADAVSFYASYALLSFAVWPLIVHRGGAEARHAGLVYIVLAAIGELAVLSGLILAAFHADAIALDAVRAAVPEAGPGGLVPALLIAGFAIKAGLVPLHVWKPLAYTAAPAPAAAVLSGAVAKAGLFGAALLLTPPEGESWPIALMTGLGLFGAVYAALVGLTQIRPKSVLAYSSASQLSLALGALGAGLLAGAAHETLLAAAGLFALHHGLAKGALFLGAGTANRAGATTMGLRIALGLAALSIAGLPLTGGAVAKLALKHEISGLAEAVIIASAASTALVLARFFAVLPGGGSHGARLPIAPAAAIGGLCAAAVVLPWIVMDHAGLSPNYPLELANLLHGLWPLALAGLAWGVLRGVKGPEIPAGDILVPIEAWLAAGARRLASLARALRARMLWRPRRHFVRLRRLGSGLQAVEDRLSGALPGLLLAAILTLGAIFLFAGAAL